ncbi:MAG: DUF1275 domain-containing protein, partial [Alphaproteobacteria bacterium]|nr:DUF1275 domain-containing protein [Alphaproteobacteria bacterium]
MASAAAEAERTPLGGASILLLMTLVLSLTAGSVDVISFLGLGGLFTAHITGNLVILAAHVVSGGDAPVAPMLSVPVFMAALGLSRLLAAGIEAIGVATARPLLLMQFLLLAGFLALCLVAGNGVDPGSAIAIVAGMLGVSAMAVQNVLVQIALKDAPPTAVMTSNVTRYAMDLGEILLGRDPDTIAKARRRAQRTWPAIVGFTFGCGLGAACEARFELWSLLLPTGLALVAFLMGLAAERAPPN